MRHIIKISAMACLTMLTLQGCAPLILGAVGVGAAISTDRRPALLQSNDKGLQIQLDSEIKRDFLGSDIEVTVWNRHVLLTGFALNSDTKAAIQARYLAHPNIAALYNEIQVGFSNNIATSANDAALTARIRSALLATKGINSSSVKVTSHTGRVYLLGWLNQAEMRIAIDIARTQSGASEVVNLIEQVQ